MSWVLIVALGAVVRAVLVLLGLGSVAYRRA